MRCVVTGAAGFIGSHLCEYLLKRGDKVRGIDAMVPYYSSAIKERNIAPAKADPNYRLQETDLRYDNLDGLIADADIVFHLAAMPGLNQSWTDFEGYTSCNILATQRLLETIYRNGGPKLVYASTSSVYGRFACGDETMPTVPISPYGVTKLAAEQLCRAYGEARGLKIVYLRYFSVYGPRQRPDMGYYKFIHSFLHDEPITVCGDGQQIRGNTYVADCVEATARAAEAPAGEVYNIGGGETASVWEIIQRLELLAGRRPRIRQEPARPGDQRQTRAVVSKITNQLGWKPHTRLDDGLARQWAWQEWEAEGEPQSDSEMIEPATANSN